MCDGDHTRNHCVGDIFACMQATVALTRRKKGAARAPGRDALTVDMYAVVGHLMRASNVETFDMIAELDLSFTQIKALCALDTEGEERSVKALAESMQVSLPGMSRAIDGLYERGLVDRREDPVDRRMKRVRLTPAGRATTTSLAEGRLVGIKNFLSSLSDEEADALGRVLGQILASRPEIARLRPEVKRSRKGARR
jgi:DNA-binding MarR family transcriptional regulator